MDRDELERKRGQLAKRLDDGWQRIEQADRERKDVQAWETFWIGLLNEYERICDALASQSTRRDA